MIIERKVVKDNYGRYAIKTVVERKSGKEQNYFITFQVLKNQKKSVWLKYYEDEIKKGLRNPKLEQYENVKVTGNL